MPRPMGIGKRSPDSLKPFDRDRSGQYARTSKADLMDAYADLYRQTHGDDMPIWTIMADLEHRNKIMRNYRRQEN